MSFGYSWIAGTHTRNKAKTYKRCDTIAQNTQSCVTLTKRAHKTEQTDERSPRHRHILKRAHIQVTQPEAAMWGRPNPRFCRTCTSSWPPQLWKEGCHRHPNVSYQRSRPYLTREPTSPHYKRASTHPLKAFNSSHSFPSHTQGGEVGVGLHLYH